VQTATITSGVLPGVHAPAVAAPLPDAAKVVDTTAPAGPGSDAAAVAPSPVTRAHGTPKTNARRAAGNKTRGGASIAIGVEEIPQLPDPSASSPTAPADKPKAPSAKPDPADMPLPVFPIPGDPPSSKP
jgi:hypothetical protein